MAKTGKGALSSVPLLGYLLEDSESLKGACGCPGDCAGDSAREQVTVVDTFFWLAFCFNC